MCNRPCSMVPDWCRNQQKCMTAKQELALSFNRHHLLPEWHIHLLRAFFPVPMFLLIGSHKTLGNTQRRSHRSQSHLADTILGGHMICPRSHFFLLAPPLIQNPVFFLHSTFSHKIPNTTHSKTLSLVICFEESQMLNERVYLY